MYSEFCEHGQAASCLELTCLPASSTCCLDLTCSCPPEARDMVLQSQRRHVRQSLQHQDKGCQCHLLKQSVLQSKTAAISSEHPRPHCKHRGEGELFFGHSVLALSLENRWTGKSWLVLSKHPQALVALEHASCWSHVWLTLPDQLRLLSFACSCWRSDHISSPEPEAPGGHGFHGT